ncbi:GWT1-domain-containing protein [Polychytrium aggregatum]|uniref:GWT1-domain-containing protein n=1 Tax=Polychytrium aggregatum TaxID=110093 RepID=UPI0022FDD98C|nr:GWT1-domain-containing protein [Polychytrium aggregatum]KAI9197312.1 GWT1-domain-containing protein [Polychytrium aggregatum]
MLISVTFVEWIPHTVTILLAVVTSMALLRSISSKDGSSSPTSTRQGSEGQLPPKHVPYFVIYRALVQLLTVVAILAVDFSIFPRMYAKTHRFGVSLMDSGVGAIVCSGGLVVGERLVQDRSQGLVRFGRSIRTALPVLFLGFARLLLTRSVDYEVNVSEYGVHWNFFMTLAFIPIIVSACFAIFPRTRPGYFGILLVVVHQALLSWKLEDYVLHAPRTDLISMNKEGVVSTLGYASIYLISAELGRHFLTAGNERPRDQVVGFLVKSSFAAWFIHYILTSHLDIQPSRAMANGAYVVWIIAMGVTLLLGIQVAFISFEWLFATPPAVPLILCAINKNQLTTFLLANILTGLVNLSLDTMSVPPVMAFIILLIYVSVILATMAVLHSRGVRIA